ncbi:SusC/RagA family TonB-linked outer membrane protein [Lewinella cohaerens]|uniref:SusC/RagA family TonB-linked outer membrane protein n=1 Tax=Lewinella cohaerens TaxID=70995 RepID=UPI000364F2F6|nr:SusC/RagA family TonB-linked outer membrane protein [Lewinella cohaerens]
MKKLSLVLSLVLFAVSFAIAQRTVSGTITDDGGEPLIGASILVKGTSSGTVTDIDGSYSLEVPDGSTTLVVSYTGFETREVAVGASNLLDITMSEGVALDEVVVTGLGIRRDKKALGYAVTTLGNDQLELRPEADVARVLRGKVPGVDISQTSGLAGSGTNVIIRGYSSITGSNQPLFVVDGVPFNSDTNNDRGFDEGGSSASSRFLDIDPNNIAEVSVLKGLSATVLYGEAGRNGVILVTTKNGNIGDLNKKFEVTVDQSFFANDIASLPDDQDSWGNGFHNFASAAFSNWGANFNERTANDGVAADGTIAHPYDRAALNGVLPQYAGARYNYQAYDNLQNFFQTGLIASTSVNIANRLSEGTSLNFSYGYRSEEGFIPLSTFDKHNLGLGINTKLANGLELVSTFNYVTSERQAPPTGVSFSSNPTGASLFSNIFYTPRSVDLTGLEYENPQDFSSIGYRGGNDIQNPYWTLNNSSDNERVNRFFGTIALKYKLTDWLSAMYRVGYDGFTQTQRYSINKGGTQEALGLLETSERNNTIIDHNLNLQYNARISDDLTLDGVVGVNVRRDTRLQTFANSSQQFVYNLLTHDNFINHLNESDSRAENLIGAYATASLGFKNFLYLNVQARNDYTSTLEKENRSILYPSVSASFIATEAFAGLQNNTTLNYLKLRLGYGTSAGYPNPYQTRNILGVSTRDFVTNGGTVVNTNTVDNRFGNPDLKPELHSELEFGVEARLFNNRFGIDLSLYNKESTDLIIDLDLDPSTGYENTTINAAAITNKGIELGLDLAVVQTSNLRVALNANYTRNVSNVDELAEGIDQLVFAGYSNLGNFAIVDQPYGVIQGEVIARDENGNRIVQSNGTYLTAPDLGILGDPNPAYVLNYGLNVNFKGIALNALMTYSDGGIIYSTLPSTLMARGILAETDFDRYVPVVAPGVKEDGTPNDIQITSTQHYWQNGGVFQDEMRVYDASYLKLREVSISYSLPGNLIDNSPFGTVTMTLSGQNLWFKALGFPAGANFDPEVLSLGVGNGRGFELMNVPTSRQIGGSVRVTF